ncbi:hypothetical protein [Mesorhizobium silamurunense]|uniref:hypothetical protein n=1 Tax=Mesorhizobium silamurunense TaxID=499528 RepID=UPI001782034D|nr:hypothetical protein [Mesorhizobium silamurunense]
MFSPISNVASNGGGVAADTFLPVTIRGEMPGRAMRGGTDIDDLSLNRLPYVLPQIRRKTARDFSEFAP